MKSTEDQGLYEPRMPPMAVEDPVVRWLLQGDPAIRWQVLRDLLDAEETVVAIERARVEHEGWGARLLARRAPDGLWANGACFPDTAAFAADTARALAAGEPPPPWPSADAGTAEAPTDESGAGPGQPWTATYRVLLDLCDLGAPPDSPVMQETAHLVARNCRWECDGLPFFAGEEDCCINAGTILIGTYLGVVRQHAGCGRCPAEVGAPYRGICGGPPGSAARRGVLAPAQPVPVVTHGRGGQPAVGPLLLPPHAGTTTCSRPPSTSPGAVHFRFEEPDGTPSRWNTLRALRVLRWYDASAHSADASQRS